MADHFTVALALMDDSFNSDETRNYGLSVFFSDLSCTFCILDFRRNKFIGLQRLVKTDRQQLNMQPGQRIAYPDFLDGIFRELPWMKGPFKSVRIAYEGKVSTLIPAPLFDPDERENYLKFSFFPGHEEQVFSDHLLSMDCFQVFSIPKMISQSVGMYFPEIKIVHAASVVIESIWINYKNRINSPRVFLHPRPPFFDLVIFDGRQMTYFNTFSFLNPEDITYYLIFVLEQLNFNPETVPLVLLGDVEKESALAELLYRYVKHVEFARRNDTYRYSYMLNQLLPHAWYPLFNFFSCGL